MSLRVYLIILQLLITAGVLVAQPHKVIDVAGYGIKPNSRLNIEPIVRKILREHTGNSPVTIKFEPGRYDFWPHHQEEALFMPTIGFNLTGLKDVTIDGAGAEFIFHGRMMPFRLENSVNIQLKNFSIDWDRPFISQARIVLAADSFVDMYIDPKAYPYVIEKDSIYFVGEGWRSPVTHNYNNLYDKDTKDIVYQTRDNPLGGLPKARVSMRADNVVRFHFKPAIKPEPGTYIALYHGSYITDGILILNSLRTSLENINIFHTLSCGVHGYKSEDISLKNVNIRVNEEKGRVFSTVADATHFNGCKGTIVVDGTLISGVGDDFINVHGMYAKVKVVENDSTVVVAPNGRYIGFSTGESAWAVDSVSMKRNNLLRVKQQEPLFAGKELLGYRITFTRAGKGLIKAGDLLENKDRNPDVVIRNCRILKKNRARGVLVTTAGKVLIEDNYFNTAGAAILIEGDTELWFESGASTNVVIRNNEFENCYTSGNNIVDAPWGWGEGVISITPSVRPSGNDFPAYHHNILIEKNLFKHFDYQVLFARATNNLSFRNNTLVRTYDYKPFYRETNFYLDGCRNVSFDGNKFEDFTIKNITINNMRNRMSLRIEIQ